MSLSNRRTVWLSALEFGQGPRLFAGFRVTQQALPLHKISPKIDFGNREVQVNHVRRRRSWLTTFLICQAGYAMLDLQAFL
jgi:hypothetical protein